MINNKKTFRINEVKQIEVKQKEIDTVEKIKAVLDSIGEVSTVNVPVVVIGPPSKP